MTAVTVNYGSRFGSLVAVHKARTLRNDGSGWGETSWLCWCDCGQALIIRAANLLRQKSCGCLQKKKHSAQVRGRLRNYNKNRFKEARKAWHLDDEYAISLFLSACRYCKLKGTEARPLGIDREDSSKAYTKENSYPCCGTCNKMKLALTHTEFLQHIARILQP